MWLIQKDISPMLRGQTGSTCLFTVTLASLKIDIRHAIQKRLLLFPDY